ncbi:hypothetical protein GCM10009759_55110 [Kitasatospora saccharophila]|uniref:Uncharacterized protein n=1 Tax=Kitasatospora saccharophila TaxID=407973 RepID=A0ABN2XIS2_9ACTN
MAIISPPAWQQGGSYGARTDRLSVISGLLSYPGASGDEATPLRVRSGVKPSYQNQQLRVAAQGTPNMSVQVSAGFCYVENKDLAGYGAYTVVNDGPVNLPIAASSGSQYRKDTVVVQVLDAETLGTVNSGSLLVVQGPYAASAGATTRGTIPPNSVVLADVAVDAGVTSITAAKISDGRQFQVASGGIIPVTSTTLPDHPAPGQTYYLTDTDTFVYGTLAGTYTNLLQSAGASAIGQWQSKYKAGDTPRASTTTVSADPDLAGIPVVSGGVYRLQAVLFYSAHQDGDLRIQWTAPGTSTLRWHGHVLATGSTGTSGPAIYDAQQIATVYQPGGADATNTPILTALVNGTLVAGAAGTVGLTWAQAASHATATIMRQGSTVSLQRLA